MSRSASIGLEVPCRKRAVATVQVTVTLNEVFLCYCEPRAGRLVPPRALAKALRRILLQEETKVRTQLTTLPKGQQARADELVKAFKSWKKHVEDNYLTPHYLRLLPTEQFKAFALPNALRCQLLRQCYPEPLAQVPPAKKPRNKKPEPTTEQPLASAAHLTACHVRLVFIWPVTPCLRLLDKVAVYLREPHYCPRTHRYRPFATGNWWPIPDEHVHATLCNGAVMVVVE